MNTVICPHCGKPIEFVEPGELKEQYGWGQNSKERSGKEPAFPMPVLRFPNRNVWLKSDIEAYIEDKSRKRISSLVHDFEQTIAVLPEDEREQALEMLVGNDGSGRKRR